MDLNKIKAVKSSECREKNPLKEVGLFIFDILYNAAIIILLVIIIRTFLISPFRVIGSSMVDTLYNNEFILIDKLSYRIGEPKRGDPIVFLPPITNNHLYKFEKSVITDINGIGTLNIGDIKTIKQSSYCQNWLMKKIWICEEKINKNDIVYYIAVNNGKNIHSSDLVWKNASKTIITESDIKAAKITIKGDQKTEYAVRIYSQTGPEYFVKRIIGIPGDTITVENGRIYLQTKDGKKSEINETYLNKENKYNTYSKKTEFKVPEGSYFVLGDNRNHSNDSRHWISPANEENASFINKEYISGKVLIVLWPVNKLRLIKSGLLQ